GGGGSSPSSIPSANVSEGPTEIAEEMARALAVLTPDNPAAAPKKAASEPPQNLDPGDLESVLPSDPPPPDPPAAPSRPAATPPPSRPSRSAPPPIPRSPESAKTIKDPPKGFSERSTVKRKAVTKGWEDDPPPFDSTPPKAPPSKKPPPLPSSRKLPSVAPSQ